MSAGLTQPKNGSVHTSTFLFKILISVLSIVVASGVLTVFDMSHTLVRIDEHMSGVDRRLIKIEAYQSRQTERFFRGKRSGNYGR